MREEIYTCDKCAKILSSKNRKIAREHLSIQMGKAGRASIATKDNGGWMMESVQYGYFQFCNSDCLAGWAKKKFGI